MLAKYVNPLLWGYKGVEMIDIKELSVFFCKYNLSNQLIVFSVQSFKSVRNVVREMYSHFECHAIGDKHSFTMTSAPCIKYHC